MLGVALLGIPDVVAVRAAVIAACGELEIESWNLSADRHLFLTLELLLDVFGQDLLLQHLVLDLFGRRTVRVLRILCALDGQLDVRWSDAQADIWGDLSVVDAGLEAGQEGAVRVVWCVLAVEITDNGEAGSDAEADRGVETRARQAAAS